MLWAWPVAGAWIESLGEQPFQFQDEPGWVKTPGTGLSVIPVTYAAMLETGLGELGPSYVLTVNPVTSATNCSVHPLTFAAKLELALVELGPASVLIIIPVTNAAILETALGELGPVFGRESGLRLLALALVTY